MNSTQNTAIFTPQKGWRSSTFGVLLDERSKNGGEYRYAFQNQEMDDEVKGEGNSVNYKYRIHDPRIGRFFAVDPLSPKYPHNSTYAFSENRVIDGGELEGLEYDNRTNLGQTDYFLTTSTIENTFDYTGGGKGTDYIEVTTTTVQTNKTTFKINATGEKFEHNNWQLTSVTRTKIEIDSDGKIINSSQYTTHYVTTYPAPGISGTPKTTYLPEGYPKSNKGNIDGVVKPAQEYADFVIKSKTTGNKLSPVQEKANGNDDINSGVTHGGLIFAAASFGEALAVGGGLLSKSRLGGYGGLVAGLILSGVSEMSKENDPTKIRLQQNIEQSNSSNYTPNK